jgi:preprotein translocase subunit SecF
MQFLNDSHIDFMKYRKAWITLSLVLLAIAFVAVFVVHDLNFGIDFAGGTQVTLGFRETPKVDEVRTLLEEAGLKAPAIQRYGKEEENQVILKTTAAAKNETEEKSRDRVVAALNGKFNQGKTGLDLNQVGSETLAEFLLKADPDGVAASGPVEGLAHYRQTAAAILAERKKTGIFHSLDGLSGLQGVSPPVANLLKQQAYAGDFTVLQTETVGPQVGKELRSRGFWAVISSLVGMLLYIWIRFELRFGIGAVMAGLHDVIVTLGIFALMGYEFNLTTVAAFLTLIGYSMNDTVVIFDRMRENMRKTRRKPLLELMNDSLNQTLSRTIMTSGLTFLTVLALLVLGGEVLRGFAFVMTVGIIVGTYSSIYIASPFALLWEELFGPQGKWRRNKVPLPGPRR